MTTKKKNKQLKEAKPDLDNSDRGMALQVLESCKLKEVGKVIIKLSKNTSIVVSPSKATSEYIQQTMKKFNIR